MKETIINAIHDCCIAFFYHDRTADEELSRDQLLNSIKSGEITIDEIINEFSKNIKYIWEQVNERDNQK